MLPIWTPDGITVRDLSVSGTLGQLSSLTTFQITHKEVAVAKLQNVLRSSPFKTLTHFPGSGLVE